MNERQLKSRLSAKELENLEEDVAILMGQFGQGHLTRNQAQETAGLFPIVEEALQVTGTYFSLPKDEREILYGNYDTFLETLRKGKLGPDEKPSLYELEVEERTAVIPREKLMQVVFKERLGHEWEHQDTRSLG
jgi:hypothetical protein